MTDSLIAFDLLLAAGIVWMGWASLASVDPFRMIVTFMAFGILVSLAWIRLDAPDVALAEAAVGAGVTGALFLRTIGLLRRVDAPEAAGPGLRLAAAALAFGVTGALIAALVAVPRPISGYDALVADNLGDSGVTNPVTAVLLNFRAYDTLLEIVVLVAALLAVVMIGARQGYAPRRLGPLFEPFARFVVPLSMIVAGYLLWIGSSRPGGAFQAGSVLGAGLIVLLMGRIYRPWPSHAGPLRLLSMGGLAVFVAAAAVTLALSGGLLQYPDGTDKAWILGIESALTVSIAIILAALFHGGLPRGDRK